MPIKDKSIYPSDWQQISLRIREREGQRCKFCSVENGAVGARDLNGEWHSQNSIDNMNSTVGWNLFGECPKIIRIVLTVAHLDHDPANNADDNLAALCQKCHLNYDSELHKRNSADTREAKKSQGLFTTARGE